MTIVEYKLDPQDKPRSFNPKTIPTWVTDGGHWWNPENEKMIAVVPDDNIPEGATTYTLEELQARQRGIQANYPMKVNDFYCQCDGTNDMFDKNSDELTDEQIDTMIADWVDARI